MGDDMNIEDEAPTMKQVFTEIYAKNLWGGGSGGGSSPENTIMYRAILKAFMEDNSITDVVDFGCGDWQFSKLIDWRGVKYHGVDIVDSVIAENNKKYAGPGVTFGLDVPQQGELLIIKDVLQHWYATHICQFLDIVAKRFKYILITNTSEGESVSGPFGFRPLSAKTYPLHLYKPKIIAIIHTSETKEISLIS